MTTPQYPKIDRSKRIYNFEKTAENDAVDIGWSEGILDDGRPYWIESWRQDQISCITIFISTLGLENATKADFLRILSKNELLRFEVGKGSVASARFMDPAGNEFWSLNAVIGDEDELYAIVSPTIYRYKNAS